MQVWRPRELNTHETEWGFSCMSYEISGALGIKMANPNKEVIAFVGDGSYLLYNSDIYSSVITNNKLIIIVCDNGGHAVINRLQLYKGGKEFNCLLKSSKTPNLVPVDFASHAKSMGADGEQVNSISELEEAFKRAKKSKKTYVFFDFFALLKASSSSDIELTCSPSAPILFACEAKSTGTRFGVFELFNKQLNSLPPLYN